MEKSKVAERINPLSENAITPAKISKIVDHLNDLVTVLGNLKKQIMEKQKDNGQP